MRFTNNNIRDIPNTMVIDDPHILLAHANSELEPKTALAELIANSFGHGQATRVEIIYNRHRRTMSVNDNGGGMEHIYLLLKLGASTTYGQVAGNISKYGVGGTDAMLSLSSRSKIWTMRGDGRVMFDDVPWTRVMHIRNLRNVIINDEWYQATPENTPRILLRQGQGVHIMMYLRRDRILRTDSLKRELARRFAPGLRQDLSIIWTTIERNGQRSSEHLTATALPRWPRDPNHHVKFAEVISHDGERFPIRGEFGLFPDLSGRLSKATIGFYPQVVIETAECYTDPEGLSYSGRGVAGYVDLGDGWQNKLSTHKEDIDDHILRGKLMTVIFEKIKPLLEQTEQDEQAIILNNFVLDLEGAFNRLATVVTLSRPVGSAVAEGPLGPRPRGPNLPNPRVRPIPDPNRPRHERRPPRNVVPRVGEGAGVVELPQPPTRAKIDIDLSSDEDMERLMCHLDVVSESQKHFRIALNKDHPTVKKWLRLRRDGRRSHEAVACTETINSWAATAMAAGFIRFPNILQRCAPALKAALDEVGVNDRQQLLARLLFDNIGNNDGDGGGDDGEEEFEAAA